MSKSKLYDTLNKVVEEVLALKRPSKAPPLPRFMNYEFEQGDQIKSYQVPIDVYSNIMYQSILNMRELNGKPFSEAEVIFHMAGFNDFHKYCNIFVKVAFHATKVRTAYMTIRKPGEFHEFKMPQDFKSSAQKLESFIDDCKSNLVAIPLSLKRESEIISHRNLMVALKLNPGNILCFVYEPHGFYASQLRRKNNIIKKIVQNMSPKFKWIEMDNACPIGLQRVSGDRTGFCVMYSLFFLFCLLRSLPILSQIKPGKMLNADLASIEHTVLELVPTKELNPLMTNFAILFCESFWQSYSPNEKDLKQYEHNFGMSISKRLAMFEDIGKPSIRRKLPKLAVAARDENQHYVEDEDAPLLHDGQPCQNNGECLSQCCEKGKCVPFDLNDDSPNEERKRRISHAVPKSRKENEEKLEHQAAERRNSVLAQLRKVEEETKSRNSERQRNRVLAQLRQVEEETKARNADRKIKASSSHKRTSPKKTVPSHKRSASANSMRKKRSTSRSRRARSRSRRPLKPCAVGKSRNPDTNRCRKDCAVNEIRNPKTKRCVKKIRKSSKR